MDHILFSQAEFEMDTAVIEIKKVVNSEDTVLDYLYSKSSLSKVKIKDALSKGCCLVKRKGTKYLRIRKAKYLLRAGDSIHFSYKESILSTVCPPPTLLLDKKGYSVWNKPCGVLTQGTHFGDHCSLMRAAELYFQRKREIKIVHRLDMEASGLVLLAHNKKTAADISLLIKNREIIKKYRAVVHGIFAKEGEQKTLSNNIDGKSAETVVTVEKIVGEKSHLEVQIITGRKHQIRKHLSGSGYPIVGDSLYGKPSDKNKLHLAASEIQMFCPVTKRDTRFSLPNTYYEFTP